MKQRIIWAAALGILAWASMSSVSSAASQAGPAAATQSLADLNRADCDAIRGTDYLSEEERAWFLTHCVGGVVYVPVEVYVPVYVEVPAPLPPPVRPLAPEVAVTCSSSIATATAAGDLQQVPLAAIADVPIYCTAAVSGYWETIDWAGGFINGNGTNFTTTFSFRTTPWTIRVQVNWGGNPVIKYISVSTVGYPGCVPQAGYQVCILR